VGSEVQVFPGPPDSVVAWRFAGFVSGFRESSSARRETPPCASAHKVSSNAAMRRLSKDRGGLAQLGEHLLCKQGVVGSIPSSSTKQSGKLAGLLVGLTAVPISVNRKQ
jgi:hypothetical protein